MYYAFSSKGILKGKLGKSEGSVVKIENVLTKDFSGWNGLYKISEYKSFSDYTVLSDYKRFSLKGKIHSFVSGGYYIYRLSINNCKIFIIKIPCYLEYCDSLVIKHKYNNLTDSISNILEELKEREFIEHIDVTEIVMPFISPNNIKLTPIPFFTCSFGGVSSFVDYNYPIENIREGHDSTLCFVSAPFILVVDYNLFCGKEDKAMLVTYDEWVKQTIY